MVSELVVISGLPGVGKSAVAAFVAEGLGAVHLSIDTVEEALLGIGMESGWTTGVAAYEAVRAAAETNLGHGRIVVVDAVNDSEPARETWRRAAKATGADLRWIVLVCSDPAEHARRLAHRERGFLHVAEPSWDDVVSRGAAYAAWSDPHAEFDSTAVSADEIATRILDLIRHDKRSRRDVVEFRHS